VKLEWPSTSPLRGATSQKPPHRQRSKVLSTSEGGSSGCCVRDERLTTFGWRPSAGGWRPSAGGWRLAAGGLQLAAGGLQLAAGGFRLAASDVHLAARDNKSPTDCTHQPATAVSPLADAPPKAAVSPQPSPPRSSPLADAPPKAAVSPQPSPPHSSPLADAPPKAAVSRNSPFSQRPPAVNAPRALRNGRLAVTQVRPSEAPIRTSKTSQSAKGQLTPALEGGGWGGGGVPPQRGGTLGRGERNPGYGIRATHADESANNNQRLRLEKPP